MKKKAPKFPKLATKSEIEAIKKIFLENYPNSVTELHYENIYQLVISVALSAQCTDKRVNLITPALFKEYPDTKALAKADIERVKEIIHSCSFFNNKAKNLIAMAAMVEDEFGGEFPLTQKELVKLPGVGQKTANVVLIEYTGANLMAVDTHVFRVAHRLGLSRSATALETEADLTKKLKTNLHQLHQAMVLFGRYKCKAISPECKGCILGEYCKSKESFKAK